MNFELPDKFVPERWKKVPEYQHDKSDASQPFYLGLRQCLARKYVA